MNPGEKRKPTLKELMIMQGKIKPEGQSAPKAAASKTPDLKRRIEKAQKPEAPKKSKWQETRDDRIKMMIEQDPEQAAELLKKLFLKGKQG